MQFSDTFRIARGGEAAAAKMDVAAAVQAAHRSAEHGTEGDLCRVMRANGSDKSVRGKHNYTLLYEALLAPLRTEPLRIFELGLGTAACMWPGYVPGASLRGWSEYLPKASVFGADIDRSSLFAAERIKTGYCDQLSPATIEALWAQPAFAEPYDLIVEDGLHTFEANVCFFEHSVRMLRPGGVFVIEDVARSALPRWSGQLLLWRERYPDLSFHVWDSPLVGNDIDNVLLLAQRQSFKQKPPPSWSPAAGSAETTA